MSRNHCQFSRFLKCSNSSRNRTGLVCDHHLAQIYCLEVITDKVVSSDTVMDTTKLCATYPATNMIFPFPFDIKPIAAQLIPQAEYTHNGMQICLDTGNLFSSVETFLNTRQLGRTYNADTLLKIRDVIAAWISSGTNPTQRSSECLTDIMTYKSNNQTSLSKHHEGVFLTIATNGMVPVDFPMAKLPMLYQAIFANLEYSFISAPQGAAWYAYNLTPNLLFSTHLKGVMIENINEVNRFYVMANGATWASPLIATGIRNAPDGAIVHTAFSKRYLGEAPATTFLQGPMRCQ
ncbi:31k virion structural protein [Crangon crangon nudivirus]|uniref:31k virion structural protein n=1 Tax=Crangon crangon nudivirus TaxID=2880838 RepID=A0AAE9BZ55_9VIRU|nr:31k virion structural protein [Crangon crangon nudivirus]UBZ25498.1 31k virion structural protein [Crangon crangon nudivirus]